MIKLDSESTETNKRLTEQTIDRFKRDKTLKEKNALELKIANRRTPKYTTPKIHKAGNPGRRVVSSINSPSKISEFIDFHLQPIVTTNCN